MNAQSCNWCKRNGKTFNVQCTSIVDMACLTPKVEIDPNRVDLLLGSLWLIDYKSHAVGIFGRL